MMATNLTTTGAGSMISYSLHTSIPVTYHTQLQSWLNTELDSIKEMYYYATELVHAVQQHLVVGVEYEGGDAVWVAMEAYQLDQAANEEYDNRYSGKIDSSIDVCGDDDNDDDDDEECTIDLKPRETRNITLSLYSSFVLGTYSVRVEEGDGHQDTVFFSTPVVTMGPSYTNTPPYTTIMRPGPPSDTGTMQHTGTRPG